MFLMRDVIHFPEIAKPDMAKARHHQVRLASTFFNLRFTRCQK